MSARRVTDDEAEEIMKEITPVRAVVRLLNSTGELVEEYEIIEFHTRIVPEFRNKGWNEFTLNGKARKIARSLR